MHPSKFAHLLRISMGLNINLKMNSILMLAECSQMVNLMLLNLTDNRMEHSNTANPMVRNSMENLLNRLIHSQLRFLYKISHLIRKSHHKCLRLCQLQHLYSNHNLTQLLRLIKSLNLRITNSRIRPLNKS